MPMWGGRSRRIISQAGSWPRRLMRSVYSAAPRAAAALVLLSFASHAAATKLLRFPDVWHDRIVFSYAGDLWTVGTRGGTAARLTSNPGLELFGKFSPDGRFIAFTGQYGADERWRGDRAAHAGVGRRSFFARRQEDRILASMARLSQ